MKASKFFSGSYLKAIDLQRPVTVTIERVVEEQVGEEGKQEPRLILYFRGKQKGLCLNKTNFETLLALTGHDETDRWIGITVQLFNDMSVTFNNSRGGIRIRNADQIMGPRATAPASTPKEAFVPPPAAAEEWPPTDDVPF